MTFAVHKTNWPRRLVAAAGRGLIAVAAVLGEGGLKLTRTAIGPGGVASVDDLRIYPKDPDGDDVCPYSLPENWGDQPRVPKRAPEIRDIRIGDQPVEKFGDGIEIRFYDATGRPVDGRVDFVERWFHGGRL